jgi:hypothetical protein
MIVRPNHALRRTAAQGFGSERVLVILLTSWALFLSLGFLVCPVFHSRAHDWHMLPGITIEHRYGHGWLVEDIRPLILLPALSVSYALTWYLFRVASRFGKHDFKA